VGRTAADSDAIKTRRRTIDEDDGQARVFRTSRRPCPSRGSRSVARQRGAATNDATQLAIIGKRRAAPDAAPPLLDHGRDSSSRLCSAH
jgi:hypothetical protein